MDAKGAVFFQSYPQLVVLRPPPQCHRISYCISVCFCMNQFCNSRSSPSHKYHTKRKRKKIRALRKTGEDSRTEIIHTTDISNKRLLAANPVYTAAQMAILAEIFLFILAAGSAANCFSFVLCWLGEGGLHYAFSYSDGAKRWIAPQMYAPGSFQSRLTADPTAGEKKRNDRNKRRGESDNGDENCRIERLKVLQFLVFPAIDRVRASAVSIHKMVVEKFSLELVAKHTQWRIEAQLGAGCLQRSAE